MAKREMSEQPVHIMDKEWNSIQESMPIIIGKPVKNVVEPVQVSNTAIGIVTNCKKLNLRTKPSKAATIIYEIPANSQVTIDFDKSVNGWLRVRTESGTEGFCMKEFVSII